MKALRYMIVLAALAVIAVGVQPRETAAAQDPQREQYIENLRLALEDVCLSMKPYMERPDKVKSIGVMDNPEINAYADSGGNIVFFTGMMNFVRSEHEVAAVCGHELSHLSGQHIKRSIGNSILATVAQVAIGGTLGDVAGAAIQSKQSRSHEREADERGLEYMWAAGYNPEAIWKFWQSLKNHYDRDDSGLQSYFGTHPVDGERIENLKVLLVRKCTAAPDRPHCDEILANENYVSLYNAFEAR